jgi:photoactive yellow protein
MRQVEEAQSTILKIGRNSSMTALPGFETPMLAEAVEALPLDHIDQLPFGVIGLDSQGIVRVFNRTEAEKSGFKGRPAIGKEFFIDVAPCMNNSYFKGRIDKAIASGTLDVRFTFVGDFSDRNRELAVRVQGAKDGGTWIFLRRSDT